MNLNIAVGVDSIDKEAFIDFEKHRFILLAGHTGTGKSVFHNNLYKQLVQSNTPEEIGFIFLDMTMVDFSGWTSPYIIINNKAQVDKAIEILEAVAQGKINSNKHTFIHIEECDMFYEFAERSLAAIKSLINREDVTVIYSTSRYALDEVNTDPILDLVDMKIIFKPSWTAYEKGIMRNSGIVFLKEFSRADVQSLQKFQLK